MEADFDRGWDGVWISEARITSEGWTATVETREKRETSHRRVSSVRRRKKGRVANSGDPSFILLRMEVKTATSA
jgi:hypothetical protein